MNIEFGSLPVYIQPMQIKKYLGVIGRTKALDLEANDPTFPKRISLFNGKATAWRTVELIDYIERVAGAE